MKLRKHAEPDSSCRRTPGCSRRPSSWASSTRRRRSSWCLTRSPKSCLNPVKPGTRQTAASRLKGCAGQILKSGQMPRFCPQLSLARRPHSLQSGMLCRCCREKYKLKVRSVSGLCRGAQLDASSAERNRDDRRSLILMTFYYFPHT